MSTKAIDAESNSTPVPEAEHSKGKPKQSKKHKATKKPGRAKKPTGKPKADRTNKKAEVIALMKRAKGATLKDSFIPNYMPVYPGAPTGH